MAWISLFAVYFILWWTLLFVSLPIGLRTQEDEGSVVEGTSPSAPSGKHMLRVLIRTTVISTIVMGVLFYLTRILGYTFDDIPVVIPHFG